jgi:molecular chaperone DnaK
MAENDKRGADRVPAALRLKLRYTDVESFIDKFSANVSKGGIFIASKTPKPVGSLLRFEFQLADGSPVVRGEGKIVWVKEFDPAQPNKPHGMGVKFTKLDNQSKSILDRMLALKGQARGETSGSGPLPVEGSGMVAMPAQGSGPQIVEGSGPRPVPREASAPTAVTREASGPRPVPREASAPTAVTREASGPRSAPRESSAPRPVPPRPPMPRLEPSAPVAILAPQAALDELEALAREVGMTEEVLAAVIARAREIAAGANGDLAELLHFEREAPSAAPPRTPRAHAPLPAGAASAAAHAPSFNTEEHTSPEIGPGSAPRPGIGDDEPTMIGSPAYTEAARARTFADDEGEPTPIDMAAPYGDPAHQPPDEPGGGARRGRLGDVVKKIFGK